MRVTLLANVWLSHKPSGVSPLPPDIATSLGRAVDIPNLSFELQLEFHPVAVEGSETTNDGGNISETAKGSTYAFEAPLGPTSYLEFYAPASKRLSTGDCKPRHAFVLRFERNKYARILTRKIVECSPQS